MVNSFATYGIEPSEQRLKTKDKPVNSPTMQQSVDRPIDPGSKRRSSSFVSSSSPWFRRNSFLSPTMIQNENFSVYEAPSYYSESASYNIISLRECQGFIFNQDLFASPYQQLRALANEKRYRTASFNSHTSRCKTPSRSGRGSTSSDHHLCPSADVKVNQRRHTSYLESRPSFFSNLPKANNDSAIIDDDDVSMNILSEEEGEDVEELEDVSGVDRQVEGDIVEDEDEEEEEEDDDDDDDIEEEEEYGDMGYGGDSVNRRYKVHVTEIIVNEDDDSMFPSMNGN